MRTNIFGLAQVVFAVAVTSLGVGCGGATDGSVATQEGTLTTTYDKLTVVAEMDERGVVRAAPQNADGETLLVLRVAGDRMEIEPRAGSTLAPWSGTIPAGVVQKNELSDWSYLAYAYASGLKPEPRAATEGGVTPQMISAGTDGQMCIAAGGTAMQCAYYLYCSRHWCPFW